MLTPKQRSHLRGLAHKLKPVVHIGKGGIDDGLLSAVETALLTHELIKVKVGENAGVERHEAGEQIATKTCSQLAGVLGNIVILYKPHPDEPTIVLP